MSTVERAARVLKSLKAEEWKALGGIEKAASAYGPSDAGRLSRMTRLPIERVKFAVEMLARRELVERRGSAYLISREGVETLALKEYADKDLIFALGAIIAKGKESDVYEALTEEGEALALKFYKIGRTSFTRVRKKRAGERAEIRSWMTANYEAAKREYSALRALQGLSPSFPKAIAYCRSTVLLEELSGVRLSTRPYLEDAEAGERKIFELMRTAYSKAGLINADLSEYNILTDGRSFWLIDWPQAVRAAHPNSRELLMHDVGAVSNFFRRAYGVESDPDATLQYVMGGRPL